MVGVVMDIGLSWAKEGENKVASAKYVVEKRILREEQCIQLSLFEEVDC